MNITDYADEQAAEAETAKRAALEDAARNMVRMELVDEAF